MKGKRQCLIELGFLEGYSKLLPAITMPDENIMEAIATWANLNSFISRSSLTLDCTPAQFNAEAQDDPNLKQLWKKNAGGECSIKFHGSKFNNIEDLLKQNPLCLLLTEQDKTLICSNYGVINVNLSNFSNKAHYFKDNGAAVKMGDYWDWEEIRWVASEAANSLIIVDNYIFKGDEKSNLYKILDIILPKSLKVDFHLTVFYIESRPGSEENLKSTIKRIRPNLNIVFEFIKTTKDANNGFKTDFHDRAILTNNLWIDSGSGFNLLRRDRLHFKADKSTTVSIAHVFFASKNINWLDNATANLIDDANATLTRNNINSANRLLK